MTPRTSTQGERGLPRYFARLFQIAQRLENGRLDVCLPDGRVFRAEGRRPGPVAEITLCSDEALSLLVREGDLGFAEGYIEGHWTTPDLQSLLDLIMNGNENLFNGYPARRLVMLYERIRHALRANTRRQAKRNIAFHYDLGNEFYEKWLDETMTYSSALFETGQEDMERAQIAKYKAIVDAMGVQPGDHVLEIGCGWGGFAEYAARERGLRVTGLTISQAQHAYATQRMARAGLSDKVEIVLRDYRDETGTYDGVASIEMFEAVGEKYWPVYFSSLRERLKPGARATLQVITIRDEQFQIYREGVDFIRKYVFPGGMLPSPTVLDDQIARAGLDRLGSLEFGQSYSQTLRRWHERFEAAWDDIRAMGFDDRFYRMWRYYLTVCAASFKGRNCDVTQVTVARPT